MNTLRIGGFLAALLVTSAAGATLGHHSRFAGLSPQRMIASEITTAAGDDARLQAADAGVQGEVVVTGFRSPVPLGEVVVTGYRAR